MNMKKGSANMWWIIIGAVIALVVMIVLMMMFTSKSSALESGLLDCDSKGGDCVPSEDSCVNSDGSKGSISSTFECTGDEQCCFKSKKDVT